MVRSTLNKGYAVILIIAVAAGLFVSPDIQAVNEPLILGAHRGNSAAYVENTMDALREAVGDQQYQFIEIDVQYTEDGKIVVYHDGSLERFQKMKVEVGNLSYEELASLSRYDVLTYEKALEIIGNKPLNVEIKSQGDLEEDQRLVDDIVKDARKRGTLSNILLSSISADVVKYIKDAYPSLKAGQIFLITETTFLPWDFFTKKFYGGVKGDYIMLHGVNARSIEPLIRLKPEGKTLAFWYFDDRMIILDKELW